MGVSRALLLGFLFCLFCFVGCINQMTLVLVLLMSLLKNSILLVSLHLYASDSSLHHLSIIWTANLSSQEYFLNQNPHSFLCFNNKFILDLIMASFWWVALQVIFFVIHCDALRANCALGGGIKEAHDLIICSENRSESSCFCILRYLTWSYNFWSFRNLYNISFLCTFHVMSSYHRSWFLLNFWQLDNFETFPSVSDWKDSVQKGERSAEAPTEHGT